MYLHIAQQPAKRLRRLVTIDDPITVKRNKTLRIETRSGKEANISVQENGKTNFKSFNK